MKYAIVTGATQGIGRAVAEKLLQEGFSVAACARNEQELGAAQKRWESRYPGLQVLCIRADLSDREQVRAFADRVLDRFPGIDLLVNNAGLYTPGSIADEADGSLERLMAVNLYSAYHLTRRILPFMKRDNSGHIFNLCSVASLQAYPGGGSYSITKYALNGFSENLRLELMPYNIKVTAVFPGAVYTRSWSGAGIPEDRIMRPEDVAGVIWAAYSLSTQANVDKIVLRPLKGDL